MLKIHVCGFGANFSGILQDDQNSRGDFEHLGRSESPSPHSGFPSASSTVRSIDTEGAKPVKRYWHLGRFVKSGR